jgi:hypothetical protein
MMTDYGQRTAQSQPDVDDYYEDEPYSATSAKWWAIVVLLTGTGLICIWTEGLLLVMLIIAQITLAVFLYVIVSYLRAHEWDVDPRHRNKLRWGYHGLVCLAFLVGIVAPTMNMYLYTADNTPLGSRPRPAQQPTSAPTRAPLIETPLQETEEPLPTDEVDPPPRTSEPETSEPPESESAPEPEPTEPTPEPPEGPQPPDPIETAEPSPSVPPDDIDVPSPVPPESNPTDEYEIEEGNPEEVWN